MHKTLETHQVNFLHLMNRSGHKKNVLFEYFTKSEALGCIYGIFKDSADVSQSSSALLIHRGSGGVRECAQGQSQMCVSVTLNTTGECKCLQNVCQYLCVCVCVFSAFPDDAAATSLATSSDSNLPVGSEEWN